MSKVALVCLFVVACAVACTPKAETIMGAAPKQAPAAEVATVTAATTKEEGECHHEEEGKEAAKTDVIKRGAAFANSKSVELSALLQKPEGFDKQTITTVGTVRQVCQKKGCWMEVAADAKGPGARITFKDYEFFVPKDASGKTAKIEGSVKLAELSEERAKHYASEGATVPRGPDGKAREVQLVATSVELR